MESKEEKSILLEHYSGEVCSHIEASVSLFFGLVGTLFILTEVDTIIARTAFSFVYFALGGLGIYFYFRLFYYRKLLEEVLLDEPYKDAHARLENLAFKDSKLIKLTQGISRHKNGEYRLTWAWFMLTMAIIVAVLSWVIIVFSL